MGLVKDPKIKRHENQRISLYKSKSLQFYYLHIIFTALIWMATYLIYM